ncbi:AbgT family transporter [Rothia nasimurium]|uniref:AbgT family transporter n=1 Tax=Rothia nasimurium TaxID=85336 RepID=UPI001F015BAE|nr:AbgT family transporter [Rothia nasimurium]
MSTEAAPKTSFIDRTLNGIERIGNKLPEPFTLFTLLFLVTALASSVMAWNNVIIEVPGADEPLAIKGFFTPEGITWFTTTIGENYIGFPPLLTVVTILLAIGIAEKSGFLAAAIRFSIGGAPRWVLPYAVGFIGVVGSIMADSVFLVIPPLAALAFKAAGRHPLAGLLGGFAAAGAGYSTNVLPTSLDALFAGITNSVIPSVPALAETAAEVSPISNYYFNIISAIILALVAGFVIDRVLEPRIIRDKISTEEIGDDEQSDEPNPSTRVQRTITQEQLPPTQPNKVVDSSTGTLSNREKKALAWGTIAFFLVGVAVLIACLIPDSPWRNEEGGFLPKSPLLSSIVFIIFLFFSVSGYVYGRIAGTVRGFKDVPTLMGEALKDMVGFLVLAFVLGQFIALFNWSGLGSWIAVSGATVLENAGLTGFPVIIMFIILCSVLNLFIISGSGMWTLMAAVFVPMFGILGFEPAFIQGAFRVGDSATQIVTPMNPYLFLVLAMVRKYEPKAGLGTMMARLLPFVFTFWLAWLAVLFIFYTFNLPMGPGAGIMIGE